MMSSFKPLFAALYLWFGTLVRLTATSICDLISIFDFKAFTRTFQARNGWEAEALTYEQWRSTQKDLDSIRGVADGWASFPNHTQYDYTRLQQFRREIDDAIRRNDYHWVCSRLRAELSRNLCKILSPALYQKSLVQTKRLIHEYVEDMCKCIWYVAKWEGRPLNEWSEKATVLQEVREQVFGRTSLVLSGGAMISMCHIGVVKALFQRRLLPQIVTGVATGCLVAAIVGVSTDNELRPLLELQGINMDAFVVDDRPENTRSSLSRMWRTIERIRFHLRTTGHTFNIEVLQKFAKDNLGDMTFEEAYLKTGRILNVTIAMSDLHGTPQLLNYITGPHVLIWSAVVASVATSHQLYAPTPLFCKSDDGSMVQYQAADAAHRRAHSGYLDEPKPPLQRLAELFCVNHFIVSQTRPYIFPFIWLQRATNKTHVLGKLVRLTLREGLHWLTRLNAFGLLPAFIHRIVLDEIVPTSAESLAKLNIIPHVRVRDMFDMVETPTLQALKKWSRIGEESTWPFMLQIHIRCSIELELERALKSVSHRKDSMAP